MVGTLKHMTNFYNNTVSSHLQKSTLGTCSFFYQSNSNKRQKGTFLVFESSCPLLLPV